MLSKKYQKFSELIVYQIYPRSFYDANGDGIGDLKGITKKVSHLKELGINAVWLCPCYKSPNVDNGYDVSDYYDIMDEFGTLEDWKEMCAILHKNGIKVIMDIVPNHTSDKHKWFIESKKSKNNAYSDYYYWADKPLNDWQACFGGSVWEYCPERNQYYMHSYAKEQPDLNWDNPKVREEICNILDFWVNLGVDGFRIDVIDQISKDFEGGRNCFGKHLHQYINQMFGRKNMENIFTVGECWANDIEEIKRHALSDRKELTTLFQFDHIHKGRYGRFISQPFNLKEITDDLSKWQRLTIDNDIIYTLFSDNHDQPRFLSRFGNDAELRYESATMFAGMFYLLKGIPFIYQGQEWGMTNSYHTDFNDFRDVENLDFYNENKDKMPMSELMDCINFGSRDNARRPLSWNDKTNGGFSNVTPWIPAYSRYSEINLEKDKNFKKSVFEFYKNLLKFRKENKAIMHGDFIEVAKENNDCFVYERVLDNDRFLVVCNFEKDNEIQLNYDSAQLVLSNYFYLDRKVFGEYKPFELAAYKI